jgi:AcrR family transcriptional regulator
VHFGRGRGSGPGREREREREPPARPRGAGGPLAWLREHGARRDQETRDRLRAVATAMFAERGFRKVTVREICHAARANVAAVNYHFGDKLGLYLAIVQDGIAIMRESNQLAEEAGRGLPPDARLRAFLRVFLSRVAGSDMADKGSWISQIMSREMEEPTPALDLVIKDVLEPRLAYLGAAIAELLGCPISDNRVKRCFASIQGQCLIYRPHLVRERFLGISGPIDVDRVADHITDFSLAGIRALASAPAEPGEPGLDQWRRTVARAAQGRAAAPARAPGKRPAAAKGASSR